jgi:hypothetical protein
MNSDRSGSAGCTGGTGGVGSWGVDMGVLLDHS